jgi:hypothetical protein
MQVVQRRGEVVGHLDGLPRERAPPGVRVAELEDRRPARDEDPAEANWFDTYIYGDGSTIPLTDYHPATVTGNFTWMRVRVEGFSGGTINAVTITY